MKFKTRIFKRKVTVIFCLDIIILQKQKNENEHFISLKYIFKDLLRCNIV